jgi:4'-phosphopantetheinyl transferase
MQPCADTGVAVWLLPLLPLPPVPGDGAAQGLDAQERARARRLRSDQLRQRFVAAHALQRALLAHCTGLLPHQVPLAVGPTGKPLPIPLADGRQLHHNLSHTGDWLLLAVSHEGPVGADIEQVQPRRPLDDLARMVFSPRELRRWRALSAGQQALAFHAGWTQKEAWLKANGLGLGLGLDADGSDVSFRLGADPVQAPDTGVVGGLSWCVPSGVAGAPLVASVVAPGRRSSITLQPADLQPGLTAPSTGTGTPRTAPGARRPASCWFAPCPG